MHGDIDRWMDSQRDREQTVFTKSLRHMYWRRELKAVPICTLADRRCSMSPEWIGRPSLHGMGERVCMCMGWMDRCIDTYIHREMVEKTDR